MKDLQRFQSIIIILLYMHILYNLNYNIAVETKNAVRSNRDWRVYDDVSYIIYYMLEWRYFLIFIPTQRKYFIGLIFFLSVLKVMCVCM